MSVSPEVTYRLPYKLIIALLSLLVLILLVVYLVLPKPAGGSSSGAERNSPRPSAGDEAVQKVNVNTASREELLSVPGIGPATADRIIGIRENNKFTSLQDVFAVPGVTLPNFNRMKDKITVD